MLHAHVRHSTDERLKTMPTSARPRCVTTQPFHLLPCDLFADHLFTEACYAAFAKDHPVPRSSSPAVVPRRQHLYRRRRLHHPLREKLPELLAAPSSALDGQLLQLVQTFSDASSFCQVRARQASAVDAAAARHHIPRPVVVKTPGIGQNN